MPEVVENIPPRNNTYLLGHEEAEKFLLEAWKNNSLHNSWLFSGIEGIGKATLAYKFARFLLSADFNQKDKYQSLDIPETDPVFKLVSNNAHPDFKIIERDYTDTDKKKLLKAIKDGDQLSADEMQSLKKSAFIRVDDVRTINEFLSKRSSQDGWRVVLIDSIDDMNTASANAILKILEEPPFKTVLILINHNPNRLLTTIKSRCAKLNLKPLSDQNLASLLRRYRSNLSENEISGLVKISSGSIGQALDYADHGALERYNELTDLIQQGSQFKLSKLFAFCDKSVSNEDSYNLSKNLILKLIRQLITQTGKIEELSEIWNETLKIFSETEGLNLDKKQALINIINNLCKRV